MPDKLQYMMVELSTDRYNKIAIIRYTIDKIMLHHSSLSRTGHPC